MKSDVDSYEDILSIIEQTQSNILPTRYNSILRKLLCNISYCITY